MVATKATSFDGATLILGGTKGSTESLPDDSNKDSYVSDSDAYTMVFDSGAYESVSDRRLNLTHGTIPDSEGSSHASDSGASTWLFLRPPGSESGSHEDADAVGVVPASPDGAQRSAMFYLHLTKGKVHIEK